MVCESRKILLAGGLGYLVSDFAAQAPSERTWTKEEEGRRRKGARAGSTSHLGPGSSLGGVSGRKVV